MPAKSQVVVSSPLYLLIAVLSLVLFAASDLTSEPVTKYWVFFVDKGLGEPAEISEKALARRELRGSASREPDLDIYPDPEFMSALRSVGLTVHNVSRWLNAASVSGDPETLEVLALDFVRKVRPVAAFKGDRLRKTSELVTGLSGLAAIDYGPSFTQLHICQIDSLHSLGYSGRNVLFGMIDTGFWLDHPAFRSIISFSRVAATHDFINGDDNVDDNDVSQQLHGTATWSVVGGLDEGSLVGAAYGADFMLAKTEIVSAEVRAEEDNWIAAIEWMEAQGADVISSSLGYSDWYVPSDLDGNTAPITMAADAAAALGVVVVNAAGNERGTAWNTILAPADGDSVIAVGGVLRSGGLYPPSSPGPTADGRTKPDVSALASAVWSASALGGYSGLSGTSLSTPVVAGGLALILEAHPGWSLDQLFTAIRTTASMANNPNNDFGWGIPRFFDMFAVSGYFTVFRENPVAAVGDTITLTIALFDSTSAPGGVHQISVAVETGTAQLLGDPVPSGQDTLVQQVFFPMPGVQALRFLDSVTGQTLVREITVFGQVSFDFVVAPNPAIDSVVFLFNLKQPSRTEITVFNVAGDRVADLTIQGTDAYAGLNRMSWNATNEFGGDIASGVYIANLRTGSGNETIKFAFVDK